MKLFHVSNEAPPETGGIAQYLKSFIEQEASLGVQTEAIFVIGRSRAAQETGRHPVDRVVDVGPGSLEKAVASAAKQSGNAFIVFHYSGYGYHASGAPIQLINQLLGLRRAAGWPLLTVFHEEYALGYPWQRCFWLTPLQVYAMRILARGSDAVLTTTDRGYKRLAIHLSGAAAKLHRASIPATIGEPVKIGDWHQRGPTCILFGQRGRKAELLRRHLEPVCRVLTKLGVREIRDMGESLKIESIRSNGYSIPVRSLGKVSDSDAAREFELARYFLIDTPPPLLGKSTIFANGIAFGCIPLLFGKGNAGSAGLEDLVLDELTIGGGIGEEALISRSAACALHYRTRRSWAEHLECVAHALQVASKGAC